MGRLKRRGGVPRRRTNKCAIPIYTGSTWYGLYYKEQSESFGPFRDRDTRFVRGILQVHR